MCANCVIFRNKKASYISWNEGLLHSNCFHLHDCCLFSGQAFFATYSLVCIHLFWQKLQTVKTVKRFFHFISTVTNITWLFSFYLECVGSNPNNSSPQKTGRNSSVWAGEHSYVRRSPRKHKSSSLRDGHPLPPKRPSGRPKAAHPDKQCGDCVIWLQMGAQEELKVLHHSPASMKHPGEKVNDLKIWLDKGGIDMTILSDSCICPSCFTDFNKQCNDKPRYFYQLQPKKKDKHCYICHQNGHTDNCQSCDCSSTKYWGPNNWSNKINKSFFIY